jgi:hypothetical protein
VLSAVLVGESAPRNAVQPWQRVLRHSIESSPRDKKGVSDDVIDSTRGHPPAYICNHCRRVALPKLLEAGAAFVHILIMSGEDVSVTAWGERAEAGFARLRIEAPLP